MKWRKKDIHTGKLVEVAMEIDMHGRNARDRTTVRWRDGAIEGERESGASALCPPVCQKMSGCVGGGMVMAVVGRPD